MEITQERFDELVKTDKAIQRTQHKLDILKENRKAILEEVLDCNEEGEFFVAKNRKKNLLFVNDADGKIQQIEVV